MTCLRSAERALNEYQKLDEFTYLVTPIVLSVQLLIQALLIIFTDDDYLSCDSRIPDFDSRFLRLSTVESRLVPTSSQTTL